MVVLLNAVGLNVYRADNFDHPRAGFVAVAAMVVWTAYAIWAYADPRRRTLPLLVVDLALALGLMLASPLVKGPEFNATIPGFWIVGALLAWSIQWRWQGGVVASVLLAAADLSVRDHLTQTNYGHVFLLLILGPIVGFMCESLSLMAKERDAAVRAAVADAERARLARAVHDGVLQVLALVQRRGRELGGDAAELGRLAGEQESALRSLIRQQDAVTGPSSEEDLAAALTGLERSASVSIAAPAEPVPLPAGTVAELVAVVRACLDNIEHHVGAGAPAWVLLEALPDRIHLSVRDEGPGIPPGRLEEAERDGRLGVCESIRGRVADLGGEAVLSTGSFGTEWEITVPRG